MAKVDQDSWSRYLALWAMILFPCLLGLGSWQLQRATTKESLLAADLQYQQLAPVSLAEVFEPASGLLVHLDGHFDERRAFLLDNRTRGGRAGYEVLSPFRLADGTWRVLVNRGWTPASPYRQVLPEIRPVEGRTAVQGRLHFPVQPLVLAHRREPASGWPRVVQKVDMEILASQLGPGAPLFPHVVRLDADSPGAYEAQWEELSTPISAQRHRAYALQWFAMAAALLILYDFATRRSS